MKLETVKIEHEGGFCVINKSDYDPKQHKLYGAPKKATSSTPRKRASSKSK